MTSNPGIAELMCEPWCIRHERLEAFLHGVQDRRPSEDARAEGPFPRLNPMKVEGKTASISISGVLLKSVPSWVRYYEIDATGYDEIQEDVAAALANPDVKEIRLVIDSPGGQLSGITEAAAAIKAATKEKRVEAYVDGGAYSAAYWLASQARSINVTPTSGVGSIGTFLTLTDMSGMAEKYGIKVHLVTTGRHKGVGAPGTRIEQDQLEPFQNLVDGATDMFVKAVASGRRMTEKSVRELATGDFWLAAPGMEKGLVDAVWHRAAGGQPEMFVELYKEAPPGGPATASETISPESGESKMNEQERLAAAEAKAKGEGATAERQRMADLTAAFPGETAFVQEQYVKGATVAEAHVAFTGVVVERNRKLQADLEAATKSGQPTTGPAPVANTGSPAAQGGADFMQVAKADRKDHQSRCIEANAGRRSECCGMAAAISRTATANPALHEAFIGQQQGRAGEIRARKMQLNMNAPIGTE